MVKNGLAAIFALSLAGAAESEVSGTILFRDAEPENRPAAGVDVVLEPAGSGPVYRAATDPSGSYRILGAAPGTYRIRVGVPGFRSEASKELVLGLGVAVRRGMDLYVDVKEDPALPRALLIGDSISNGYTSTVRLLLAGKANLHRIPASVGTVDLLAHLDAWLGTGRWDVIHFNCGLHDFPFTDRTRTRHRVPADAYAANLEAIVRKLQSTGAVLIWASTTPVPEGDPVGRRNEDALEYNRIAERIMVKHGIDVDDLYAFVAGRAGLQRPANVHFTREGSEVLGRQVAASVRSALEEVARRSRRAR